MNRVEVPIEIYNCIKFINDLRKVDINSPLEIQDILFRPALEDIYINEAAHWIKDNPENYLNGIKYGFEPYDKDERDVLGAFPQEHITELQDCLLVAKLLGYFIAYGVSNKKVGQNLLFI